MAVDSLSCTQVFVREILESAGETGLDDVHTKLYALSTRVDALKVDLKESLLNECTAFLPQLDVALDLRDQTRQTLEEMAVLSTRIEQEIEVQLRSYADEFADMSTQLAEARVVLGVLGHLVELQGSLRALDDALQRQDVNAAATHDADVQAALTSLGKDGDRGAEYVEILGAAQERGWQLRGQLLWLLDDSWGQLLNWQLSPPAAGGRKEPQLPTTWTVSMCSGNVKREEMATTLRTMKALSVLDFKMQVLAERLKKHVLVPIVSGAELKIDRNDVTHTLRFKQQNDNKGSGCDYERAFPSIRQALAVFNISFLSRGQEISLLGLVGPLVADSFLDELIKKCLEPSIPTKSQDLPGFTKVADAVAKLENTLQTLHFIDKDNGKLSKFVGEVDMRFASKKKQEILVRARALMCDTLQETVKVTAEAPFGVLEALANPFEKKSGEDKMATDKVEDKMADVTVAPLATETSRLPDMLISVCVQRLLCLAYDVCHEASTSLPYAAVNIVHGVFELFLQIPPTIHRDALATLPRVAALHHNNCMYIAHHLATLGHQVRGVTPDTQAGIATFVDLVPMVQRAGTKVFLTMMVRQRDLLLEGLQPAQGFANISAKSSGAGVAVTGCVGRLHELSQTWSGVLPWAVYYKSMGTLSNSLLAEVAKSVVSLEDISSTDAGALGDLLHDLAAKIPPLFADVGSEEDSDSQYSLAEVARHVTTWEKVTELKLLLNSGMHEIADRWADGQGPLASQFSASEVKQLIRALFQNTARRAAVLTEIR